VSRWQGATASGKTPALYVSPAWPVLRWRRRCWGDLLFGASNCWSSPHRRCRSRIPELEARWRQQQQVASDSKDSSPVAVASCLQQANAHFSFFSFHLFAIILLAAHFFIVNTLFWPVHFTACVPLPPVYYPPNWTFTHRYNGHRAADA
jgi:hypothetical protein